MIGPMLKGFTHARLACGCRITFREGVEGSPVTVVVDEKSPVCTLPVHVRDPKDAKILALALGGNADYLVTGDDDLLVLNGDPRLGKLQIVTVHTFLTVLQSSE